MSEPHERLDRAMRERSLKLKKRWVQIAKEAGISTAALGAIRRGEYRPSPHTALALDAALLWIEGSVENILNGGDPTTAERFTAEVVNAKSKVRADEILTGEVHTPREVRQQKIAAAKQLLREALDENEQTPAEDVDAYRLEERIARLRRLMAQRRDTASAAELDLMLKMYEAEEEAG